MKRIVALLLIVVLGISLLACNDTNDTENTLIEQQYQEIKVFLNDIDYSRDQGITFISFLNDLENGSELSGKEALLFSYNWLTEHSDYKDCADYLSRFVMVDNALTKIIKQTTDVFGQVDENVEKTYYYDSNGECFQFSDLYKIFEFVYVFDITEEYIKDCQYNDNGKLLSADLYQKDNIGVIGTRVTFVYDERGNLTEADFLQKNGKSWSNIFTYNESNQLITARYEEILNFGFTHSFLLAEYRYLQYEYDEQGQLSKIMSNSADDLEKLSFYSEYIYNEDGQIKEIQYADYKNVYTYDKNGQISCIESIPLDTNKTHSYKLIYHYDDVLIYSGKQ